MMTIGPGLFRLFLSYLVVLHHSFPLRLGAWAVYVFFILSGFWICRMWRRRYSKAENPYLTFVVSRWWRLAPVFIVCTCLGALSSLFLQGGADAGAHPGNLSWWLRQLLIVGSTQVQTELPPAWSLDVEMQFYLLAPLLIFLFVRLGNIGRSLVISGFLGWLLFFLYKGGYSQLAHLWLFVGFFLIGVSIELNQWKPSRNLGWGSMLVFAVITLALAVFPPTHRGVWTSGQEALSNPNTFSSHLVNLWWVLGAVLVAPFVAWNVSQASPSFDRMLGNLAYPLYLFHWIPRQWYYHFSQTNEAHWKQLALLAANFFAASMGALLILWVIDQPLDRLRAVWVESRKAKAKAPLPERVPISS
jgi:peptidoglycan/LPS O-acetylase OafA/YrhL